MCAFDIPEGLFQLKDLGREEMLLPTFPLQKVFLDFGKFTIVSVLRTVLNGYVDGFDE